MKKLRIVAVMLILFALPIVTGGGGCPDEAVEDECSWDGDCGNNNPPKLYDLAYSVNGASYDTNPPSIYATDYILIAASYSDDEGNITGGQLFLYDDNGNVTYTADINVELGCSSNDTGQRFGYVLSGQEQPLAAGYHNVEMYWTDVCGFASNKVQGSFYVY